MHGHFRLAEAGEGRNLAGMLFLCQHGYEAMLERELGESGLTVSEREPGWVRAEPVVGDAVSHSLAELCFPHATLLAPVEVAGDSVNALAQRIADVFFESLRGERIESAWPCVFACAAEVQGLGRRVGAVEERFREVLKKKLARVARLATDELPRGAAGARGLFVFFADFQRVFVSREAWLGGQRRMADDPRAPSRSYLKIEEAYGVIGCEPKSGDTVCDLGAAPGGWSYSAAKRGARVVAVDNGPLKAGALDNPLIEHRREDAFRFRPANGEVFDWMFCDLVEDPHHVVRNIAEPWLEGRWCRNFVVMLKFGRADPLALLRELQSGRSPFRSRGKGVRIRHLYHDREEFTVIGSVNP